MPTSMLSRLAAFAAAAVLAVPTAAAAAPPQAPSVATGRPTFIVTLRPGSDAAAVAAEWRGRGAEVSHVYRNALSGFAGRMGPELAEQVRRDGRVQRIERDVAVRPTGTQDGATWGLDRIDQRTLPLNTSYTYDSNAVGVTMYVVDTGVRASHADFGGRVAAGYSAIADGKGSDDCHGHGTHVAGTAAGAASGVAKGVTIVPVRVLGCDGGGTTSGIIAGLDWIVGHHGAGPAVANLSLGSVAHDSFDSAVRRTIADGVTVVAAAGNDDADACTKSPARVTEALTVAATTSTDARSSFSNFGSCVDLFAPGSSILSAHHTSDVATATMSGTSMAAPHVAGVAALRLASTPSAVPATVHAAVNDLATSGVVTDAAGSPNRLAYTPSPTTAPPVTQTPTVTEPTPVATAPTAPAAPSAAPAKKAITVSWKAPSDGGSGITGYTVQVRNATTNAIVKTVTVSGSTLTAKVTRLTGGVGYHASVQATNAVGSSAWSPSSNTATAAR